MQIPSNLPSAQVGSQFLETGASLIEEQKTSKTNVTSSKDTLHFQGNYIGHMEMYADAATVAQYLDAHQEWFPRCAQPMAVEPIGKNGYGLTVGKYKSLNHVVEPKIGLHLLPQEEGIYRIETIPVPGYNPEGYDVDFRASMSLCEGAAEDIPEDIDVDKTTHVEWELNLSTWVEVPRFVQNLPDNLIKASGDQLLNQIVRQVSKRLTRKVQKEFHTAMDLPVPGARKKRFWQR
ncbi:DUF1997 domain-containing protein [cf. Phormidesmis sp. LEGE 11477]|uniref:DUF1997 domain-containing protein n=1 Tax=cf. Phormidesmis sp. LEGE 11477 TaxID=1828680 RepID=UPI0018818647|nr:DUF1997 domain-containing protein [cf. Phormidesmis sp. LEGE 11477]MBE9063623.1 DUF1997 domain-containing protein [cf. Phormidesmis sp. LEGE 11477]